MLLSRNIKRALIVTPVKVIGQYRAELDKYIPGNNHVVTNYEQLHKHLNEDYECLILDESHRAKNYSSNTNTYCTHISNKCKYTYLFTGTPQDKHRHEILAQLSILDIRVMPVKTRILNRYFTLNDYFQPDTEIKQFSKELTEVINCYTWGKKTEEVLSLPEEHNEIIYCPHPTMYYDRMFSKKVVKNGDLHCVADNKGSLRLYLREICSGCISWKNDKEQPVGIEAFDSTKLKSLFDLVTKIDKGIIYYEFTASTTGIKEVLKLAKKEYVVVNGETLPKQANILINKFKKGEVDYLIIQSGSGNAGLDLTNVNNIIFYSLPESYIVYHQCKARIKRIGQLKECYYWYLLCENTIEELIFKSLKKKKSFTEKIFNTYIK